MATNNISAADKQKALEAAIAQAERQFGKGSVMRLGEATRMQVSAIPTGSTALDAALGVGGIPRGRIIELYGTESSGKTTLALHMIAEAQKLGGNALFVDAEHALDPEYARAIGVDVDRLFISQPSTGDEALEIMDTLIRSGAFDIAVLDSVAALMPRQELEGDIGDVTVGAQARLMSQALRKLGASAAKSNTAVVFINQIREKVGVMYGNPETTPGGRALKFWASVRLEVRRVDNIKQGNEVIGVRTRVKVVKNKVAPPFGRQSSTSCSGRASRNWATLSTKRLRWASSRSRAPGSASARRASVKDARTPAPIWSRTPSWRNRLSSRCVRR
jgi:recombination protein RecA